MGNMSRKEHPKKVKSELDEEKKASWESKERSCMDEEITNPIPKHNNNKPYTNISQGKQNNKTYTNI